MFHEEKCGKYVRGKMLLKIRPADFQKTVSTLGDHHANCDFVSRI